MASILTNTFKFLISRLKLYLLVFVEPHDPEKIFNYYKIEGLFPTSGQPTAKELTMLARNGYELVINLAPNSLLEGAVILEEKILEKHDVKYIHLPVDFSNPTDEDFEKFVSAIEQNAEKKIWVHCAANMRVSAFVYRYRRDILGHQTNEIMKDLEALWTPNKVWASFLQKTS